MAKGHNEERTVDRKELYIEVKTSRYSHVPG
jgi:hypothetical protein